MTRAHRALVQAITEEIWNSRRLERIPEFYAADYVADYRPHAPLREGHEAIRGMVERAWAAFPDYHEELHRVVADESHAVAHFTITGTHEGQWGVLPPTHRKVAFDEIVILGIRDGKVFRQRGVADNLLALRQLGVLPAPPPAAEERSGS